MPRWLDLTRSRYELPWWQDKRTRLHKHRFPGVSSFQSKWIGIINSGDGK